MRDEGEERKRREGSMERRCVRVDLGVVKEGERGHIRDGNVCKKYVVVPEWSEGKEGVEEDESGRRSEASKREA